MPLHPKAANQIAEALKKGLPVIHVKNGFFVDGFSGFVATHEAEKAFPKNGKFRDQYVEWIDERPIETFVTNRITQELDLRSAWVEGDALTKLPDIAGFEDTDGLADRLVAELASLPWSYSLTLPVPQEALPTMADDTTVVDLTPESRLIISDLFLSERFPLTHENDRIGRRIRGGGLLAITDPKWESGGAYFQCDVQGFVGPYGLGSTFDFANRSLRRFFGLGLGLNLFTYKYKYESYRAKRGWFVHRIADGSVEVENKLNLDDDDTAVINSLIPWNKFNKEYPDEQKMPWLCQVLSKVGAALSSSGSESVALAAEWFFDSYKGKDEVLSYVRLMTCLEILLGEHADTSKVSLGELLGNRLSYLIGKSHADRTEVLKKFREIYGIRSKILHHGKHRLDGSERVLMAALRSFCERALQHEVRLIAANP